MRSTIGLLFIIGVMFAVECRAEIELVSAARAKSFEAFGRAQDCSVLRQVARDTKTKIGLVRENLHHEQVSIDEKRERLESCARENGLGGRRDDDGEAVLAEVCPAQYSEWLSPLYRAQMYQEDISRESADLNTLTDHLRASCPRLPAKMGGLF